MAKFPEAMNRIMRNVFVCKKCKTRNRSMPVKILSGKVKCRSCGRKAFRAVRKK
ncbi:hypothetical protein J4214_00975 [Candidatus Woesearchaeota archaeon]|nr:hypothetical protein [Candidatus Woesearchaeota archaeon]